MTIKVPVGNGGGQTWSLQTARADQGVIEDHTLRLDAKLPPVLSFAEAHAFAAQPGPVP